ncbi:MAG: hypothetical protein ABW133_06210, partial [Polyangiaceae bacterium]
MSRNQRSFEGRTLSSRIGAAAALLLALADCGGGTERSKPVAVDDFAKVLADAVCGNIGPCCRSEGFAFDSNACHAMAVEQLGKFVKQSNIEGTIYDADAAERCVTDYEN